MGSGSSARDFSTRSFWCEPRHFTGGKGKAITTHTDSRYTFVMARVHGIPTKSSGVPHLSQKQDHKHIPRDPIELDSRLGHQETTLEPLQVLIILPEPEFLQCLTYTQKETTWFLPNKRCFRSAVTEDRWAPNSTRPPTCGWQLKLLSYSDPDIPD